MHEDEQLRTRSKVVWLTFWCRQFATAAHTRRSKHRKYIHIHVYRDISCGQRLLYLSFDSNSNQPFRPNELFYCRINCTIVCALLTYIQTPIGWFDVLIQHLKHVIWNPTSQFPVLWTLFHRLIHVLDPPLVHVVDDVLCSQVIVA